MDLFDHKIYAAPTRVTAQAVAAMPFDMADEGAAPRAKAKKKPKPKTIPRAAPPAPERHDELQLATGQRRPLRHTPLDSDFAGSFLERDDDAAPGPPSLGLMAPFEAELEILPEADTMDTRIFMQCANLELNAAMNTLRQMMTEGLQPSGAVIGALVEAHAPSELPTAFKLLAATLKMPPESMPAPSAVLTFIRQCEMQEVETEAIGRVEEVLGGFKSRGYRMSADIKGAWQALRSMEQRKLAEAEAARERRKRADTAKQRAARAAAERKAEEEAKEKALVVAEQQARDEAFIAAQLQAEKLQALELEQQKRDDLERRAPPNPPLPAGSLSSLCLCKMLVVQVCKMLVQVGLGRLEAPRVPELPESSVRLTRVPWGM